MASPGVYRFQSLEEFRCIQDKCENTCCGDWRIPLPKKTLKNWSRNYPSIHQIIGSDRAEWMPQNDAGQCKFFDGGKCGVHSTYGAEALAPECDKYPRRSLGVNGFEIQYAYPSCPELARKVFLGDDPFKIIKKSRHDARPEDPVTSDEVNENDVAKIYQRFIHYFLCSEPAAELLLVDFLRSVEVLNAYPMRDWLKILDERVDLLSPAGQPDTDTLPYGFSEAAEIIASQLDVFSGFLKQYSPSVLAGLKSNYAYVDWRSHYNLSSLKLDQKTKTLDFWMKKHLAISFASIGLPFVSQTEHGKAAGISPVLWAKRIAYDFLIVRFCLQSVVVDESYENFTDEIFIDFIHRLYRVVFHGVGKPTDNAFLAKELDEVVTQVLCVR